MKRPTLLLLLLYLGSALFVLSFGGIFAFNAATNPIICAVCHAESPAIESWSRSSHANITCAACHVNRGLQGIASPSIWHFLAILKPGEKRLDPESLSQKSWRSVSGNICRRCHSPDNRRFTFRFGLKMDHGKHLENNIECMTCHNLAAHPLKKAQGFFPSKKETRVDRLNMTEGCWRCHGKNPDFRDPELLAELPSGANPPTACLTCHSKLWQLRPTKNSISHKVKNGVAWEVGTLRHGKVAKELDYQICFGCHERRQWCGDECHNGVSMPHNIPKYEGKIAAEGEPSWQSNHFKVVAKMGKTACDLCHNSKWLPERNADYCMTCHHKEFYERFPDIENGRAQPASSVSSEPGQSTHPGYYREFGSKYCTRCHSLTFCPKCHIGGI